MLNKKLDRVNLIDENDQIIGEADKLEAHLGEGLLHQAISLFLFHRRANGSLFLLLQQRSDKKIVGALEWANTVCANLRPGEKHEACLFRRVNEELGLNWQKNWPLNKIHILRYQIRCNEKYSENEIDHIFLTILDDQAFKNFKINQNSDEVKDIFWANWEDLRKNKKIEGRNFTPWFSLFLENNELIKKIEERF